MMSFLVQYSFFKAFPLETMQMVALVTNFIAIAKIDKTREVETNTRRSCCYALKQYKMMRAMSPEKT